MCSSDLAVFAVDDATQYKAQDPKDHNGGAVALGRNRLESSDEIRGALSGGTSQASAGLMGQSAYQSNSQ